LIRCVIRPNWQDISRRSGAALRGWRQVELVKPSGKQLAAEIDKHHPSLVVDHAFSVSSESYIDLASKHPSIGFASVDHSSLNHTFSHPPHFQDEQKILAASLELPNLWYASPDVHAPWITLGYRQYKHWYNPVYLPPYESPPILDRPCVCIASRTDWMKALPAQIAAAALIQQQTDCRNTR
jgi:hypothetical protein